MGWGDGALRGGEGLHVGGVLTDDRSAALALLGVNGGKTTRFQGHVDATTIVHYKAERRLVTKTECKSNLYHE